MAGQALSTIGVKFGYGLGTTSAAPSTWKQIEECVSISAAEMTSDTIDVTPLESKARKYAAGHADSGGTLETVFNVSDVFDAQWAEMMQTYKNKTSSQVMWFCAYHPSRTKMSVYVVEPGNLPKPEYSVGTALQYTITNVLVDLPDDVAAVEPTDPTQLS